MESLKPAARPAHPTRSAQRARQAPPAPAAAPAPAATTPDPRRWWALALSRPLLQESRAALAPARRRSYDPAGALTSTGALVLLVYAVVTAPQAGWASVRTVGSLARAVLLLAAFALIESRHHAPLVPLRIFRTRTLATADAMTVLIGTVAVGLVTALLLPGRPRVAP